MDFFIYEYKIHYKEIRKYQEKQITYNVTLIINSQQGIKINIYVKKFFLNN